MNTREFTSAVLNAFEGVPLSQKNAAKIRALAEQFEKAVLTGAQPKILPHADYSEPPKVAITAQEQLMNHLSTEMDDLMGSNLPTHCEKVEAAAMPRINFKSLTDDDLLDKDRLDRGAVMEELKRRFKKLRLELIAMQLRTVDTQSAAFIGSLARES